MKRSLLAALTLTAISAMAQTPRLSLYEEFTGETCPPCAATNPGLNVLLASSTNTPKVVAIKWQVPIPSAPSATWSLYQTYKNDINWRYQTYGYGINSAPSGRMDGQNVTTFGATSDHPTYLNNSVISTAQANMSAFNVTMNRAWNSAYTAIDVTVTIVATATFAATGPLVFRNVMVEEEIHFPVQPGTNGEKDFDDVAIAAFPDIITGTPMVPTWSVGQTQTITMSCNLPSYVRDKAQVAFVGFIQDDGTRKVAQAVRAAASPLANDAKALTGVVPALNCSPNFTPDAVISNNGSNAITDLTITPYVNGSAGQPVTWNGNLAVGASATIALNTVTSSIGGGNTFNYKITGVSGGDNNALNNSYTTPFFLAANYLGNPVAEAFGTSLYPPTGWAVANSNGGASWTRLAGANGPTQASGPGASKYDFYSNSAVGDADDLMMPPMNLGGAETPTLAFDVAYAQYNAQSDDQLDVFVSDNCGQVWVNVYSAAGSTLSTKPAQTGAFTPNASQWRREEISLVGFNVPEVLVKFVATSDYGNNMYIDNVNLMQPNPTGLAKIRSVSTSMEIFPNPANTETTLQIRSLNNERASVKVVNALGQVILQFQSDVHVGENSIVIDTKDLSTGLYSVVVDTKNTSTVKKLTVSK